MWQLSYEATLCTSLLKHNVSAVMTLYNGLRHGDLSMDVGLMLLLMEKLKVETEMLPAILYLSENILGHR